MVCSVTSMALHFGFSLGRPAIRLHRHDRASRLLNGHHSLQPTLLEDVGGVISRCFFVAEDLPDAVYPDVEATKQTITFVTAVTSICGQRGQAGIIRGGRYEEDMVHSAFLARDVGLCHAYSGKAL